MKDDYDQYSKALITILGNVIVSIRTQFIKQDDLDQNLQNLKIIFESNIKSFHEKINSPSKNIKLASTEDILIKIEEIINEANKAIGEHNKILAERKTEKISLLIAYADVSK